ncbi:hypothetical protein IMCC20628_02817 [Hoeflea sp. IMCC20628]|uniref:hypothetical protein n=1 Tax=Hoeflea sp. IMCC20628 TaxID=1620421 RepID=UPI00063ACF55|nr:hypothetical protein [Hoeflea sp. IMCC20628]AKI01512.1 hypothetical protein IMCC20628_02817 [Hoeflea sp. IMCC20628]
MTKTMAMAASILLSIALPAGAMPLGTPNLSGHSLVLDIAADCEGMLAELAVIQDDRNAYNGDEGNWALKDEIEELDKRIEGLQDELISGGCA